MSSGKSYDAWNRAAAMIVEIHNCHVASRDAVITLADVHPFIRMERELELAGEDFSEEVSALKDAIKGGV